MTAVRVSETGDITVYERGTTTDNSHVEPGHLLRQAQMPDTIDGSNAVRYAHSRRGHRNTAAPSH